MYIKENLTTQNFNTGSISRVKYIVIHYTANNGDTALGNSNYFKAYRGSSAHYFVDEKGVYQSVLDKNIAWHCGANYYYHSECRNNNSIGVELCSYIDSNGNYAFKEATVENAIVLVKGLMAKYSISISNVIRHYDVTHKLCPQPFVRDIKAWQDFRNRLVEKEENEMVETINMKINGLDIKADAIVKNGVTYVAIRVLSKAGFDVGYDSNTKLRTVENNILNIPVNDTTVEAVNINGYNYIKLRDLANKTDKFTVDYENNKVIIK